jgi:nucleotide-binding universal stress UspA family protein
MVLRDTGLDVSSIVLTTGAEAVADSVVRVAEEEQVDLILIGARGKGIIRSILIGSVSSAVLHRAKTNVLIMRHRILETLQGITYEKFCPRIYAKVLIPTDFSDSSRRFLAHLDNLPGLGRVILAHIVTHGEEPEIVHAFVEDAELALTGLKNDLSPHKFGITTAIRIGNPAHEIDRLAEEEDVSLILVTSSGKGRLQEFFLGSTAFAITELAKRPVLVVKRLPAPAGER